MASSVPRKVLKCCCCHELCWDFDEAVVQCTCCSRVYHKKCHYPRLINVSETFTCIMCEDMEKCTRDLRGLNSFGYTEHKIMARILVEILCKAENTQHVKVCPSREMYPMYYRVIKEPMSFLSVRQFLEECRYTQMSEVIWCMEKVFLNTMSLFYQNDPYYIKAHELYGYLYQMVQEWIPGLLK